MWTGIIYKTKFGYKTKTLKKCLHPRIILKDVADNFLMLKYFLCLALVKNYVLVCNNYVDIILLNGHL